MSAPSAKPVVIVDTNVPRVANGSKDVSLDCQESCVRSLLAIANGEARVAVDEGQRIVREYAQNLNASGQGVGDQFLKWLYSSQWDETYCDQVTITEDPESADDSDFLEFPKVAALAKFDRSDRKFIAVAVTHPSRPPILEAADAKWIGWAPALKDAGVTVEFLCRRELAAKYEAKHAK